MSEEKVRRTATLLVAEKTRHLIVVWRTANPGGPKHFNKEREAKTDGASLWWEVHPVRHPEKKGQALSLQTPKTGQQTGPVFL